jgi:hypothetical protein
MIERYLEHEEWLFQVAQGSSRRQFLLSHAVNTNVSWYMTNKQRQRRLNHLLSTLLLGPS